MDAIILCTSPIALVHSTAECCARVWYRSVHTRLTDKFINDALRIVTGCLCPHERTTFLSYQASNQLSFATKKPYCLLLAAFRSQKTFYMKEFFLHPVDSCGNLNQDTICACCIETAEQSLPFRHQCSTMGGV